MTTPDETPPARRARLAAALAIGLAAFGYAAYLSATMPPDWSTDFDAPWAGARALAAGVNPYGLSRAALRNPYGLYYPMPALLAALPVAWLPLVWARAAFAGATAALCAWALTRDGWHRLPLFVSMAFVQSVVLVQWGPLLVAAASVPALAGFLLAKPNLGAALGVARATDADGLGTSRRRLVAGASAAGVLGLSFALFPAWVPAWWGAMRETAHITAPVARLGGPLLLLALLRWRRPEARLLLALALMPQTPSVIEGLPLAIVCRTPREALWLTVLSYVAYIAGGLAGGGRGDGPAYYHASGTAAVVFLYLPCLVMVLRRPNEGAVPAWLARAWRWRGQWRGHRLPGDAEGGPATR